MHAVWKLILSDDFLQAYKDGILLKSFDGITRRFFPRFLTYSGDYPEKYVHSNFYNS